MNRLALLNAVRELQAEHNSYLDEAEKLSIQKEAIDRRLREIIHAVDDMSPHLEWLTERLAAIPAETDLEPLAHVIERMVFHNPSITTEKVEAMLPAEYFPEGIDGNARKSIGAYIRYAKERLEPPAPDWLIGGSVDNDPF